MLEAVVFDWHGVIDRTTFSGLVDRLAMASARTSDEVRSLISSNERQWVKGEMDPLEFWMTLPPLLNIAHWQMMNARNYILRLNLRGSVFRRIDRLKSDDAKIAVLSDCPPDKAAVIKRSGVLRTFDASRFSCDVHLAKDSPEFFLGFSDVIGIEPQKTLFVDDNVKNTDFAKQLGYQVCHYQSIKNLDRAIKISSST